jgi:HPt (histidine-containing phosphotransfer) domain-containing protein
MTQDVSTLPLRSFERDELLTRCLGREELLERVLKTFGLNFTHDLALLEDHLRATNADAVANVAHRMKGSAANVAAPLLSSILSEIEELARLRKLHELPSRLREVCEEWTRFQRAAHGAASDCLSSALGSHTHHPV